MKGPLLRHKDFPNQDRIRHHDESPIKEIIGHDTTVILVQAVQTPRKVAQASQEMTEAAPPRSWRRRWWGVAGRLRCHDLVRACLRNQRGTLLSYPRISWPGAQACARRACSSGESRVHLGRQSRGSAATCSSHCESWNSGPTKSMRRCISSRGDFRTVSNRIDSTRSRGNAPRYSVPRSIMLHQSHPNSGRSSSLARKRSAEKNGNAKRAKTGLHGLVPGQWTGRKVPGNVGRDRRSLGTARSDFGHPEAIECLGRPSPRGWRPPSGTCRPIPPCGAPSRPRPPPTGLS